MMGKTRWIALMLAMLMALVGAGGCAVGGRPGSSGDSFSGSSG